MQIDQTSTSSAGSPNYGVRLQLRRAVIELDRGRTTLADYVAQVWIPVYAPMLPPSNRATHQYLYAQHLGSALGARALRELTVELLTDWQAGRLQAGIDQRSLRRALLVLSGILQRAVQAHYVQRNPARTLLETVGAG